MRAPMPGSISTSCAVSPVIRHSIAQPWVFVSWYWLTFALALFLTVTVYARHERGLPSAPSAPSANGKKSPDRNQNATGRRQRT
jgi:hypothetical protein